MKRILSLLLCVFLCAGMASLVFADGSKFTDVPSTAWYYADVNNAVAMGLINGKTDTTYCPDDNLTYAEAYKLAACMNQLALNGSVTLKNGEEVWYSTYFEYCMMNGIFDVHDLEYMGDNFDPNTKITRSGYMKLFSKALPDEMLPVINYIPESAIPDVPMSVNYADGVYKLYRAGILQGSDELHNCKPFDNIKRSEVAAILTRMMDKTKRVRFDMGTPVAYDPLAFAQKPAVIIPESDDKISFSVKVTGGVAPYKYSWMYLDKGVWYDIGLVAAFESEFDGTMAGYNTDTFTIFVPPSKAQEAIAVKCVISDAIGNKLTTEPISYISDVKKEEEKTADDKGAEYYLNNPDESRGANPQSPITVSVSGTQFSYLEGGYVSVKVEATGGTTPYYSYRWYREVDGKWVYLAGGSIHPTKGYDPTFVMYKDYIKTPGETFRIKCVVKDSEGYTGESDIVTITTSDFALEKGLAEKTEVALGDNVQLSVKASGGKEPYKYEWYIAEYIQSTMSYTMTPLKYDGDTANITVTSNHLPKSINMITSYSCVITDAEGSKAQTSTTIVDVTPKNTELSIAVQPYRVSKPAYGATMKFNIEVMGGKELYTYEWFYDTRGKGGTTTTSLNDYPQTQVRRYKSELDITVREDNPILGKEIYCVVTDANGTKVTSEKIAVCPDFVMIALEDRIEDAGVTHYVGTIKSGELTSGDKIAFYGSFDGKYEYTQGTVDKIIMFGKNLDKAIYGDRVGIVLKNVINHGSQQDLKPLIGDPAYKHQNLAFEVLPQALSISTKDDIYTTVKGAYTHVNIYASGGKTPYKSIELQKLVSDEWVYFDKYEYTPKEGLNQYVYRGADKPEELKVRCVLTDAYGNKAISSTITLITASLEFEQKLSEVTYASPGSTLTFTVKPKGGKAPYTYNWCSRSVNSLDGGITVSHFENGTGCSGQGTDTLTVTNITSYISTSGDYAVRRDIGCTVTDATGASVGTFTVIDRK